MGTIKDAYDIVKDLFVTAKNMTDSVQAAEFCSKLLELQSMILDAREENQELKNKINDLNAKIEELYANDLPADIRWSVGGIGLYMDSDRKENYVCRHCYEELHKIYHVKMLDQTLFECPKCKQRYFYFTSK